MAESHEKPIIIKALEDEIQILKGRLTLVEDALKELYECYQKDST